MHTDADGRPGQQNLRILTCGGLEWGFKRLEWACWEESGRHSRVVMATVIRSRCQNTTSFMQLRSCLSNLCLLLLQNLHSNVITNHGDSLKPASPVFTLLSIILRGGRFVSRSKEPVSF